MDRPVPLLPSARRCTIEIASASLSLACTHVICLRPAREAEGTELDDVRR